LEGQLQISIAEARKSSAELQTVTQLNDEMIHNLQEENRRLKEKHEQSQSQLREVNNQSLE
jgi:FtsZ-binding cell division protein ZapB